MAIGAIGGSIKRNFGKLGKDLDKMAMFGTALNVGFGVSTYNDAREQGMNPVSALARGVGEGLIGEVLGLPAYIGTQVAIGAPKAAVKGYHKLDQTSRNMSRQKLNQPFMNATFADSQQAYTMRQAGMQLAKASKHNYQQSMLGNEASMMRY